MTQAWLRRSGTRFREGWGPHHQFKQPVETLPGLPGLPGHRKRNPAPRARCCWVPGWFGGTKADPGGLRTAHRPDSETGPAGTPSTNTGSICSEGSCSHAEGRLLGRGLLHRSRTGQTHQPLPQTSQPPLTSPLGMLGELQNKRTPSICDIIAEHQNQNQNPKASDTLIISRKAPWKEEVQHEPGELTGPVSKSRLSKLELLS